MNTLTMGDQEAAAILYRPVPPGELPLIAASGSRIFWSPAADLPGLNRDIVGQIEGIATCQGGAAK